ncbi:MAG: FAD-dependent oxidoreductase, partial [Deltaproteobacteria bacterium]|nr:FAD-dependent oxidoreductase [Deltaproteobacteria bacterium]
MSYDCIIVGAGPAGIFAALELALRKEGVRVLILEKGRDLDQRERKDLFCGWGGAGAFSDGKLNLSREVGGVLGEYVEASALDGLIAYADAIYLKYGAPREIKGVDRDAVGRIEEAAARAGLRLISFPIRHVGTDRCVDLLRKMRDELEGKAEIRFGAEVTDIMKKDGAVAGVKTADGSVYSSSFVILAPGRAGSSWLREVSREHSLATAVNPVDIGVRVEVPASVLHSVTDVLHEAKLTYNSRTFDDLVRTFCMNPYGVVVRERNSGLCTVNGHSYSVKKSDSTNFAILVSTTFTEPFHEPIAYGEYIARLANLLGEGIIVQRLGDLLHGRRSTEERIRKSTFKPTLKDATPGDLSFVLPYRYISDRIEKLDALDRFAPGINAPSTLL